VGPSQVSGQSRTSTAATSIAVADVAAAAAANVAAAWSLLWAT